MGHLVDKLHDKFGVNGIRWFSRGLTAVLAVVSAYAIYRGGKIDTLCDMLEESEKLDK